jgi:hypothetical protein
MKTKYMICGVCFLTVLGTWSQHSIAISTCASLKTQCTTKIQDMLNRSRGGYGIVPKDVVLSNDSRNSVCGIFGRTESNDAGAVKCRDSWDNNWTTVYPKLKCCAEISGKDSQIKETVCTQAMELARNKQCM